MRNSFSELKLWCLVVVMAMLVLLAFCSVNNESGYSDDQSPTSTSTTAVTLFAPQGSTTTYLIDEDGALVNTWESSYPPGLSAYLLDDNSLLRTANLDSYGTFWNTGGAGGRVEQYDWDGNLIWEFQYNSDTSRLHHDIEYLPNGNILMIAWEYKTSAEAIAAGRDPSLLVDGQLWPDMIIEVEPTGSSGGTIVWQWHIWDHLIQDYDTTKANYGVISAHLEKINLNMVMMQGKADWTHCNAIDYNAELDQILLTVHNFSEIWIIDHHTTTAEAAGSAGDLLYRWGNPQAYDRGSSTDQQLFVPHDGRWIDDDCPGAGDILIFNNGTRRPDGNYSTVDQITPPVDEAGKYILYDGAAYEPSAPNWIYKATPSTDFYADHISGAQRLPDGNTLICNGPAGFFFEVTTEGNTTWSYTNPYSSTGPSSNSVFRAVRYWSDLD